MAIKYRLGLDVGTASVGAAAVSLDANSQPSALIWHHVRIFSEPLENSQGTLVSKKAGRRKARMQRRQIDRRASRLRRIAHLASLLGLNRNEIPPDNGSNLPRLRALAATKKVELDDLLRIFLRLSKRRGYKGEFKAKKKGEVAEGSSELALAMRNLAVERGIALKDDADTGVTLGQYLLHRLENGLPTKLKAKEAGDDQKDKKAEEADGPKSLYALRGMVEHEFNTIWDTQSKYHAILNNDNIRLQFHEALFYQRPLKSAADLVAQCSLEPTLPRAPRAQMAFQRFRIEKTLADLRWGAGKRAEPLTPPQKQAIRNLLDQSDKVSFEAIYETLEKEGHPKPQSKGLNLDRASREELLGNTTLAALHALDKHSAKHHPDCAVHLEQAFRNLEEKTQIAVINFLAELGSPEQLDDPSWHTSFVKPVKDIKVRDKNGQERWQYKQVPRTFAPELIAFINQLKEHDKFDRLSKMDFDGGRASYSVKALNKLADWLQEQSQSNDLNDVEKHAINACYSERVEQQQQVIQQNRLPTPPATGNSVVDGALRQIRWTVNKMIDDLAKMNAIYELSEIVVELSREMSLGISRRNEREKEITKNQKARREAEKEIRAHGQTPTPSKIRRYLLWAEQDKSFCPYCNKTISLAEALDGTATEYEHIIPKSLTQVGMKRSEIVLVHHACNQEKGDLTPWDKWGQTERWLSIEAAAARFDAKKHYRKAKLLRLKDFEREVLTDESVNDFADRQYHQTSWIAKEATQWLNCLCPNKVSPSRGELTAMLRRNWRLDTVIPEIRFESNLPVLDEGGKTDENGKPLPAQIISREDFDRLKKYLEGHPVRREDWEANPGFDFNRRPDKRIDHRHHLIDAITLAMTSRSMFQQMAAAYKAAAEKLAPRDGETAEERERRIKGEMKLRLKVPEPPLRNIRDAALEAVLQCRISFKPDRYPDGALFKATAYGVALREEEDKNSLTLRQAVKDLGKDGKGNVTTKSADTAIANIVSPEVREIISGVFRSRIEQGMNVKAALEQPIIYPRYGKPIRKVRCFAGSAEDTFPIVHLGRARSHQTKGKQRRWASHDHHKRLINEGYAYLEIASDGSSLLRPVKIREALSRKREPSPTGVERFYKGDVVIDLKSQKKFVVKQIKAQGGGMLVLTLITETRPVAEMSAKDGRQQPSGNGLIRFKRVS